MGSNTEHWFVTFKKGEVGVSNRNAPADSVVRTDRAVFDEIVAGTKNASAAFLRAPSQSKATWIWLFSSVVYCRLRLEWRIRARLRGGQSNEQRTGPDPGEQLLTSLATPEKASKTDRAPVFSFDARFLARWCSPSTVSD